MTKRAAPSQKSTETMQAGGRALAKSKYGHAHSDGDTADWFGHHKLLIGPTAHRCVAGVAHGSTLAPCTASRAQALVLAQVVACGCRFCCLEVSAGVDICSSRKPSTQQGNIGWGHDSSMATRHSARLSSCGSNIHHCSSPKKLAMSIGLGPIAKASQGLKMSARLDERLQQPPPRQLARTFADLIDLHPISDCACTS